VLMIPTWSTSNLVSSSKHLCVCKVLGHKMSSSDIHITQAF